MIVETFQGYLFDYGETVSGISSMCVLKNKNKAGMFSEGEWRAGM